MRHLRAGVSRLAGTSIMTSSRLSIRPLDRLAGVALEGRCAMARWPRHVWTTVFTYVTIFVLFPLLCLLSFPLTTTILFDFVRYTSYRPREWLSREKSILATEH